MEQREKQEHFTKIGAKLLNSNFMVNSSFSAEKKEKFISPK